MTSVPEQRHLRAHADRVGHFACPHCAKEFSVKHKFQRHLRLHVAERRFACVVCGRAFLQAWLPDGYSQIFRL